MVKRKDVKNLEDIDKTMMGLYTKLMNTYEKIMVQQKYGFGMTNNEIKKEMNRLNKFYLDDFFRRAL